ncbi:MAG: pyridoxal 5'-phosphate synthase glutaminase subunit PdxT [Candidatus Heimdallarchaeota archaeon]|nr:pyridoxal 5'-phosphate synthase glutaminase subunit PdxT [Candidatus Heimdallarchaeota archaeon]
MKTIGILGIQGAIVEHEQALRRAAADLRMEIEILHIVLPEELDKIDGIVMPGGESTAMILIGRKNGMLQAVRSKLEGGLPAFGTCAGAILMAKSVRRNEESPESEGAFPFLDINILRNGYGRQKDSFSTHLLSEYFGEEPLPAVFIRAPIIKSVGDNVETLLTFQNHPVLIKQGNILASTFHPELTNDSRIHKEFLKQI